MPAAYKDLTEFLVGLNAESVAHSQKNYLAHLIAVYRIMKDAGCDEELSQAGMFHSIYGTQLFQGFKLELERRDDVRRLIGERAERLAYLNCAMDRESFDEAAGGCVPTYRFRDRITDATVELDQHDFDDLCRIHLYDWLEQVPRSRHGWGYRRPAYRRLAQRLGGAAELAYERVFAAEPAAEESAAAEPAPAASA